MAETEDSTPQNAAPVLEVVCGVIVNASGQYLACQRPLGKHLAGYWEFPGGKVELGESPEQALARELLEELSVKVIVGEALSAVDFAYGDKRSIRLLPFRCKIHAGEPVAVEHQALRWCFRDELEELNWANADLPIVKEILHIGA